MSATAAQQNPHARFTDSYTIRHHTEETLCDMCGCPLYVGDKVLTYKDRPACDSVCLEEIRRESHMAIY